MCQAATLWEIQSALKHYWPDSWHLKDSSWANCYLSFWEWDLREENREKESEDKSIGQSTEDQDVAREACMI